MSTEKDVGVNMTNSFTWNTHIHAITAKTNKLVGLLKRTCPLLNDVSARRSLYVALVQGPRSGFSSGGRGLMLTRKREPIKGSPGACSPGKI